MIEQPFGAVGDTTELENQELKALIFFLGGKKAASQVNISNIL